MQTRYARQTVLKEIGPAGQQMLAGATAVIVGLGALGSNSANLLARAGVGTLRLVDRDIVDRTNLQRQSLFEEEDAAQSLPKAEAAVRYLNTVNSEIRYEPITEDINPVNIERIVTGAAVVVDGLDNFYTRALVNEACVKHGIPWAYGACLGTYGSAATIIPGASACLNCLLPQIGQATTPPLTCETVGVLGPVAALVAAWQSSEALKIMVGKKDAASPHLVHVDLWENDFSTLPMARVAGCACAGNTNSTFSNTAIAWRPHRYADATRYRSCRRRHLASISISSVRPSVGSSHSNRTPICSNSVPTIMTWLSSLMAAQWSLARPIPTRH